MQKIIGLVVLMLAFALISKVSFEYYNFQTAPQYLKFQKIWEKDLELLNKNKKLPKNWGEISEIRYELPTTKTKVWLKYLVAPIKLKKNGTFKLDITITDWEEKEKTGVMVQYHLINKKTGDLTDEFGRTFLLEKPQIKEKQDKPRQPKTTAKKENNK